MANVELKIEGMDELQRALRNYSSIATPIMQRAIDATGAILAKYTLKDNPIPYRTGGLLQSFRYQTGNLQGAWYPTVYYAKFVHDGTGPHIIRAKNKRALYNKDTGQFFGRQVNHPGTKPNRFMDAVAQNATNDINALFASALDKVTEAIARS